MRIAIVGTGAMGSLFASHLADTDAEVWAFDVWREHIEAIRRDGLIVHRDGGARSPEARARYLVAQGVRATAERDPVRYLECMRAAERECDPREQARR